MPSVELSDLLPGLDKMVKAKFRQNDEPKDFAFRLMQCVTLCACLLIVLAPLGMVAFIHGQLGWSLTVRWQAIVSGLSIALPVSLVLTYVARRIMLKDVKRQRLNFWSMTVFTRRNPIGTSSSGHPTSLRKNCLR